MSRRHRHASIHEDLRAAFIGGVAYACESLEALMTSRAQDATANAAYTTALIICGDAEAIRKWLEQELAYELPPDEGTPM